MRLIELIRPDLLLLRVRIREEVVVVEPSSIVLDGRVQSDRLGKYQQHVGLVGKTDSERLKSKRI